MEENTQNTPEPKGDPMIVATRMLRPPKTVTRLYIVDRTAEWAQVAWAVVFGLIAFLGVTIAFGIDTYRSVMALGIGAAFGFVFPSISPLQGESLSKWAILKGGEVAATRVEVNGRKAKLYVGTYPLRRSAAGKIRLFPSGAKVKAAHYDERGYPQIKINKEAEQTLKEQQKLRAAVQKKNKNRLRPSTDLTGTKTSRRKESQKRAAPRFLKKDNS